jgi:hypothetical protein
VIALSALYKAALKTNKAIQIYINKTITNLKINDNSKTALCKAALKINKASDALHNNAKNTSNNQNG